MRVTAAEGRAPSTSIFLHSDEIGFDLEQKDKRDRPTVVKSGHGLDRSLARARARPPMRAVPLYRTRVSSSRRSSGYQELQWVMRDAGPLGSTQTTTTATAMRQRQDHRETKRAPRGKWNLEGAAGVLGTLARNSFHNERRAEKLKCVGDAMAH